MILSHIAHPAPANRNPFRVSWQIQKSSPLLKDWSQDDIVEVCKALSFLKFNDNEPVMKKGETAGFGGIILEGAASTRREAPPPPPPPPTRHYLFPE